MLSITLNEEQSLAVLQPNGKLHKEDFENAALIIDPYLENSGHLNGLLIHAQDFPGWDSFSALTAHLKFVKDHHRRISRIAISTDSAAGELAESLAHHFVQAQIKLFPFTELESAKKWLQNAI